jgi:hypothetical protein
VTLNPEESRELEELLAEYGGFFTVKSDNYGRNDKVYQIVGTREAQPIHQPPRRLSLAKQEDVGEMLDDIQRRWVIEESDSPRFSPVLVRKKNRDLRFGANYMKLNDVLWKDNFPPPQIDYTLVTLVEAKCFSTVDLKSRYWQVDLHPDNKEKAAFSTGQGLWPFTIMPFGFCNAPATFERLMETVFKRP